MKDIKNLSIFPLLIMGVILAFAISCDKDDSNEQEKVPVLSTTEATEITANTATSGGNITDDGGTTVTIRGVCWSTNENPTIDDNKTEDGTGAGSFTSSVTDLEPNTTYYLRAYATNSAGTGYGSAMSFKTLEAIDLPTLTTNEVTDITQKSATSGGNITDDGGTTGTVRGVCWSTNENPTIDDNKTEDGTGAGSFTSSVTDLEPNTTYYLRAYATNIAGTAYGSAISFTTQEGSSGSTFTDPRDDKVYQTVAIGNQEWMAENLAYAPSSGNYWAYDNDDTNVETYGYLYDWETACDVCPDGWHLPSDEEWKELEMAIGMPQAEADVIGWRGTNESSKLAGNAGLWADGALVNDEDFGTSGFTALPGGSRYGHGYFDFIGYHGYWWSATEGSTSGAWYRVMNNLHSNVARSEIFSKELGFSVRCLRD